jgi:hypothetical protein
MVARFASACALIALTVQPLAAQSACVTPAEMRAGLVFIMPTLIEGVKAKCKSSLPDTAYLMSSGTELPTRYGKGEVQDTAALTALLKKVDNEGKMEGLPLEALTPMIAAMATSAVTKDIKSETCPMIDKVFALLDPMPRENMYALIELFVGTMAKSDAKKRVAKGKPAGFTLCEVSAS